MARTGRPPKPTEQKRALGNPGKRALPSGAKALAVVEQLEPTLADHAPLDAFDQVMSEGVSWLAMTDAPTLSLLRCQLEERADLLAAGLVDRKTLRDLDKQIIELLSSLGFNPAARARLGLAEVKAASKLEAIRASQTKRGMASKVANGNNAG